MPTTSFLNNTEYAEFQHKTIEAACNVVCKLKAAYLINYNDLEKLLIHHYPQFVEFNLPYECEFSNDSLHHVSGEFVVKWFEDDDIASFSKGKVGGLDTIFAMLIKDGHLPMTEYDVWVSW